MAKGKGKAKEKQATDADLFVVDEAGDETLRRQILSSTWDAPAAAHSRRGSGKPLKSAEILAQRSKVPARTSKALPGAMAQYKLEQEKRMKITPVMKKRLRGMVQRNNNSDRGLWDVDQPLSTNLQLTDPSKAGSFDVWTSTSKAAQMAATVNEDIRDIVVQFPPKPPATLHKHQVLSEEHVPRAIAVPHPGESYNPTLDDHQAILAAEYAKALAEEEEIARQKEMKDRIMNGRDNFDDSIGLGYANEVGSGDEDDMDGEGEGEGGNGDGSAESKQKKHRRKTDKERRRKQANKLIEAQVRAQARLTKAQRQALSSVSNKADRKEKSISLAQLQKKKSQMVARLAASGLAEMKSGPSRVPAAKQAYLLSDELPESLRQLKMDGNLWNEWLDSSRRRGRIQMERNTMPGMRKQKGRSLKDREKVAWRKWDLGI